jgi:hypothetical protein
LLQEFADYLQMQTLERKVAMYSHSGYEKSVSVEPGGSDPQVIFNAQEDGSSDSKRLSSEQFKDLFTEFFHNLGLDEEARRRIFIDKDGPNLSNAVAAQTGKEIASTNIGFTKKGRYRILIDEHGSDAGLLKLQEMREDGRSAEFPNTYHVMFTERELMKVLSVVDRPGFNDETLKALFVDLAPEEAF